jgi:SBF-like CPA transporter family (DUF4137)/Chorismate mutase type II
VHRFFLHGANLSREALKSGASNWRLHLFVQASTFILFPLLGLLIFKRSGGLLPLGLTQKQAGDMDAIERLQAQIDDIDARLVALLRERFQRTREVGAIRRRKIYPCSVLRGQKAKSVSS